MIWLLYMRFEAPSRPATADIFARLCADIRGREPDLGFRIDEIGSKRELLACIAEIQAQGEAISEWHVVGYGTAYGPLLGKPGWPEEISADEWTRLQLPLAAEATAWFYMEGSDRWLAPFVALTLGVTAYGCDRMAEHGIPGMRAFLPDCRAEDAGYDPIAGLYASAFSDIYVRRDECRWLEQRLARQKPDRVLDIGCGNGALLARLSGRIGRGTGVDISGEAVRIARSSTGHLKNLSFAVIDGPRLPFDSQSFDTVISLLSFRYLDWDPIVCEIRRVLAPGGRILIVDMVASSLRLYEWPAAAADKLKSTWRLRNRSGYRKALRSLVTHPAWRKMIDSHPMRGENEFVWYLKSRFPKGEMTVLNVGAEAKILAFDSGPVITPPISGGAICG